MRTGPDPPGPGTPSALHRTYRLYLTPEDCDAWAHVIARWQWWAPLEGSGSETRMQLFRLSRAADRRDANIMSIAQYCPHARWTNTRGDVSMMRQAHNDIALRRKWDPYYSVQPVDQW